LNQNVGSKKIFKCPFCQFEVDRDVNGAFNIYIKHCVENKEWAIAIYPE